MVMIIDCHHVDLSSSASLQIPWVVVSFPAIVVDDNLYLLPFCEMQKAVYTIINININAINSLYPFYNDLHKTLALR